MKGNTKVKEPIIPFDPPVYRAERAKCSIGTLTGDLLKPFWQQGEWMEDFHDIEGDTLPRPWKKTRVKVLWDDENLYVGAVLEDDSIWANVSKRDDIIFRDNDFEIFLSPEHTGHRYYEIEMNAMNTVWDLFMERPQRSNVRRIVSWDIKGLETAVKIEGKLNDPSADNRFWSLEVKIPWASLREAPPHSCLPEKHQPVPGEIWRMNFSRVEWETDVINNKYVKRIDPETGSPLPEHNWLWAPTGVIDAHMPEIWGYLIFTENGEDHPLPEDRFARYALYKLFYREHRYSTEHASFTSDAKSLLGEEADRFNITAHTTPTMFEGIAVIDGKELHIDQDGYLWQGDER
ncbi:MAG: carbohydrate-binding family 9-like protein [Clostridia bacterium]|nr:carbohydrate-binding family 9-like protein [Clostridia bacterium]